MWRRHWLLLAIFFGAVGVRLIAIDQPFIDPWSWRQSDVAAIARNFYTNGFHFAYPQIDWAGDASGYVGTEFPILPFVAAVCYKAAGVQEWVGRGQALLFFALALPFFYLLVRDLFGRRTAAWATFFYSFAPLSIATSRAFMPDMPSLSLAIVGLYFFLKWLETAERRWFAASAVAIAFALLVKITTAVVGAPLFYLAAAALSHRGANSAGGRAERPSLQLLILFAVISLLPSIIWYSHAYQVAQQFYPHHFFGAGGFTLENAAWYLRIARQTVLSSLTPLLAILACVGAFVIPSGKWRRVFHWWAAAMFFFIVAAGWGNRHQWYQLPLVPIAAVFAASACEWIAARVQHSRIVLALAVVAFLASSYVAARPFFAPAAAPLRELGLVLQRTTPPDALVIAADDGDPTIFYYASRKGWHFLEKDGVFYGNPLNDPQLIDDYDKLRAKGASYIVFSFGTKWWLDYYRGFAQHLASTAELVEASPRFVIYRITATSP